MIQAVFDGGCSLTVNGHAGYEAPGKDIVCAGVSALIGALGYMLTDIAPENLEITIEPGHAVLRCRANTRAQAAFQMAKYGLLLIEADHGEYLSVVNQAVFDK